MSESKKIRCAIIGMGMGLQHLKSYLVNPRAEVVGAADTNPDKFGRFLAHKEDLAVFTDYKKMLAETTPDVVSIALPNFLHLPVSLDCMRAGADVLCEKPMSTNLADAVTMLREAEKLGRTVYMNLSQRFNGQNLIAKDLVDGGALGEIYHGYTTWTRRDGMPGFGGWFGQKELSGGGPLIDLGVHRIDIAMWLMGNPKPVTVSGTTHHRHGIPRAKAQGKRFDVEDFASGFVRFDNDASLLFEISWAGYQSDKDKQKMHLVGTQGGLERADNPNGSLRWLLSHDVAGTPLVSTVSRKPSPKTPYSCETLVDCLLDDKPFPATAADGIRMQIILDALYASAESGREIVVEDFAPDALHFL